MEPLNNLRDERGLAGTRVIQSDLHVLLASDQRYVRGLLVTLASAAKFAPTDRHTTLHVINAGLTAYGVQEVRRLARRFPPQISLDLRSLNVPREIEGARKMSGSTACYARLLMGSFLPDVERVIYLDVDIVVNRPLDELWNVDLGGRLLGAVRDPHFQTLADDCLTHSQPELGDDLVHYFNSGVLIVDLDFWRRSSFEQVVLNYLSEHGAKCKLWDQTALNRLLRGHVAWLHSSMNFLVLPAQNHDFRVDQAVLFDGRAIYHMVGATKPWHAFLYHEAHTLWHRNWILLVRRFPTYALSPAFWARPVLWQFVRGSKLHEWACRVALRAKIYRFIPAVSEARLRSHLALFEPSQPPS
ncbi:MAG: glycosyltransferase family 8 protein [Betaproteobacteria bacterium]|nr:MAG: glycosyltransferase family 8 protein [Betaproteobacteria bacterium]